MFTFNYTIQKEDINYGGHVGNERALLFFQMARMAFFESLGASEMDRWSYPKKWFCRV